MFSPLRILDSWLYVADGVTLTGLTRPLPERKPKDPNNQNDTTTNRRPSLFETRHASRGSNSGNAFADFSVFISFFYRYIIEGFGC